MRTELPTALLATPAGKRADEILRSCVHCGFCNATCPTYLLLGNELDGPRGRIYLIKEMLETGATSGVAQTHLDRCLTCRACETTCPSGVAYGELLEIGREMIEAEQPRPLIERGMRTWLRRTVPHARRFRRWVRLGNAFRWLTPTSLRGSIPPLGRVPAGAGPVVARSPEVASTADKSAAPVDAAAVASSGALAIHPGTTATGPAIRPGLHQRVLLLEGCVQQVTTPEVNAALRKLLADRGIDVVSASGETCCGGLSLHLGAGAEATTTIAANLAALAPHLDHVDAIVSTASGCGVTVKDYGRLLAHDAALAGLAARAAALTLDVAEYLQRLGSTWSRDPAYERIAWHAPCTLQHGQRITGTVEALLRSAGYTLVPVADGHLCCGSAGTYSMLQPDLSQQLRARKLAALGRHGPEAIATANVGCQLHLAGGAEVPVRHWVQLLR